MSNEDPGQAPQQPVYTYVPHWQTSLEMWSLKMKGAGGPGAACVKQSPAGLSWAAGVFAWQYLVCKRKLESKKEALLILSKELDTCQQERDQFKLMANQLRERHQSLKKKYRELIVSTRPRWRPCALCAGRKRGTSQLIPSKTMAFKRYKRVVRKRRSPPCVLHHPAPSQWTWKLPDRCLAPANTRAWLCVHGWQLPYHESICTFKKMILKEDHILKSVNTETPPPATRAI